MAAQAESDHKHHRRGVRTCRARLLELQWSMASSMLFTRMTGMTGPKGSSHAIRMSCSTATRLSTVL